MLDREGPTADDLQQFLNQIVLKPGRGKAVASSIDGGSPLAGSCFWPGTAGGVLFVGEVLTVGCHRPMPGSASRAPRRAFAALSSCESPAGGSVAAARIARLCA